MTAASQPGTFRRNVKWQLVGSASQTVLSGLVLLITGRTLGAGGFGTFSIILGFVYVGNSLLEPRMQDVAAKQFWDFRRDDPDLLRHNAYFLDLLLLEVVGKLLPCIVLAVLAPWLADRAQLPSATVSLIRIAAVGTYLSKLGYGLSLGFLRVLGRSDIFAYCATGELALRLALTLLLMGTSGLTVFGCIVIVAVSGIASNVVQWALTVRHFRGFAASFRAWHVRDAAGRLRGNRRLLISNLGLSASDLMNKDLDITLIAPLMPADHVGIYKMTKNITLLTWRAIDPFYLALMPELARLVSMGNVAGVRRLLARSSAGLALLGIVLSVASYLALLLLGGELLGPAYGVVPRLMPWMLVGIVCSAPLVWGHPLSVALNRADIALVGSLLGFTVGLLAFLGLTPTWGMRGAGVAWSVTFLLHFTFTAAASFLVFRGLKAPVDRVER